MNKFIEKLALIMDGGARIAVAGIMFTTSINVIMRIFGLSIRGTVEIVQYLNAITVGLGLALCAYHGGHVAVTFLTDKFPPRAQEIVNVVVEILVGSFLAVTAWQMIIYANGMKEQGEVALTLGIPVYPIVYLVTAGVVAYLLVVLNNLLRALKNLFKDTPNADGTPDENINVEDLISQ